MSEREKQLTFSEKTNSNNIGYYRNTFRSSREQRYGNNDVRYQGPYWGTKERRNGCVVTGLGAICGFSDSFGGSSGLAGVTASTEALDEEVGESKCKQK